jgi:hypothetical protein
MHGGGGEMDGFADRDAPLADPALEIALWFMLCPAAVIGSPSCCWVTFACRRNWRSRRAKMMFGRSFRGRCAGSDPGP